MKLRPYQQEAVDGVVNSLRENDSCLIVMPTGTGKTVVFSHLLDMMSKGRGMVIAHREELIHQACNKIEIVLGQRPDIEMANMRADTDMFDRKKVIVSSVQTQVAGTPPRMERFNPDKFALLILDEAHHSAAKSWLKVVKHYRNNLGLKIVGFTATPDRLDKKALGDIFNTIGYEYSLSDAIDDGWLVPIRQRMVAVDSLDYSGIRTTAGDLNGKDLARVMEDEHVLHEVASPAVELIGDRRTLLFASSVNHAERLSEIFERHGLSSDWVCGKTPKAKRAEVVRRFASGDLQILCNVGCFTEGFDEPGVECVIMARPTKSRALYSQMIGRGTRPLAGLLEQSCSPSARRSVISLSSKPFLEVIDFAGNAGRHKLVTCMSILGGKSIDDDVLERAKELATESDEVVDPEEVVRLAAEQLAKEKEEKERVAKEKRAKLRAKVKYSTDLIDPFDTLDIRVPVEVGAYDEGASDRQIDFLAKHSINAERMTSKQASKVTTAIIMRLKSGLASPKQVSTLKKFGVNAISMTRKEASKQLDRIRDNGWRNSL